ncbi:hypothetical protein JCM11641_000373 [Rhodosporidiobolus odoratus]
MTSETHGARQRSAPLSKVDDDSLKLVTACLQDELQAAQERQVAERVGTGADLLKAPNAVAGGSGTQRQAVPDADQVVSLQKQLEQMRVSPTLGQRTKRPFAAGNLSETASTKGTKASPGDQLACISSGESDPAVRTCSICLDETRVVGDPFKATLESAASSDHLPLGLTIGAQEDEHVACLGCAAQYVQQKLDESAVKAFPILCHEAECKYELTDDDAARIFGEEHLERWHYRKLLDAQPQLFCPNPRCSEQLLRQPDAEQNPQAECPSLPPDSRNPEDLTLLSLARRQNWEHLPTNHPTGACPRGCPLWANETDLLRPEDRVGLGVGVRDAALLVPANAHLGGADLGVRPPPRPHPRPAPRVYFDDSSDTESDESESEIESEDEDDLVPLPLPPGGRRYAEPQGPEGGEEFEEFEQGRTSGDEEQGELAEGEGEEEEEEFGEQASSGGDEYGSGLEQERDDGEEEDRFAEAGDWGVDDEEDAGDAGDEVGEYFEAGEGHEEGEGYSSWPDMPQEEHEGHDEEEDEGGFPSPPLQASSDGEEQEDLGFVSPASFADVSEGKGQDDCISEATGTEEDTNTEALDEEEPEGPVFEIEEEQGASSDGESVVEVEEVQEEEEQEVEEEVGELEEEAVSASEEDEEVEEEASDEAEADYDSGGYSDEYDDSDHGFSDQGYDDDGYDEYSD